ncbi:sodium/calcium exchanger family protein / calcium-binding EF hand family protein [Actinidia rufa]|uniref:Sodium/calcium exchanger family protein / calcium-binding EF hand family protein n=1 Tax=Actinidia rufa TaxID=165716 RepID=A0A7J0F133_9ERIC|nr:sodium/calcium exchanger family protein / calcium-binding EF hand family protein [Actinidia rufa]
MTRASILLFFLLLSIINSSSSRSIRENLGIVSNVDELKLFASTVTCEPTYGFLPCTSVLWGQLFLILVYEFLLSLGDKYVGAGSDLFFDMIGPGIFGASLFHILGSIPVAVFMLVSGLSASTETAEEQAVMSMALLAGSAVMFLTLIWGTCVAIGSKDLSNTPPSPDTETKTPFSFTGLGVSTDVETSYTARIMILSMVPFIILQLPKILNSTTGTRVAILVSLVVTVVFLFSYLFYQIFEPWIQNRRFEYLLQKYVKDKLLGLLSRNGHPNITFMKELFHELDKDKNGYISQAELRGLILGSQLKEICLDRNTLVDTVISAFDTSNDAQIGEAEFVKGLLKYVFDAHQSSSTQDQGHFKFFSSNVKKNVEEQQSLLAKRKGSRGQRVDKSWWNYLKAGFLLVLGTAITVLLTQPLIKTVSEFATSANISSFYVSYVVIPLAFNYRQAVATITNSTQKTKKAISLTLSEIYGAVFMNNVMGLIMFLILVYIRNLPWDVSAEVLVVLIICLVMGVFTSVRTSFPLWTSLVAYLLYPISLLLLYVLTTVLGWS